MTLLTILTVLGGLAASLACFLGAWHAWVETQALGWASGWSVVGVAILALTFRVSYGRQASPDSSSEV